MGQNVQAVILFGVGAQFIAEKQQRGANFKKEADFVLAGTPQLTKERP
jgi:hypothetical protein